MRYHLTTIRMAPIKRNSKEQVLVRMWRNWNLCTWLMVKWCSRSGKLWQFVKKLEIELPFDLAVPLLGIYPKELKAES